MVGGGWGWGGWGGLGGWGGGAGVGAYIINCSDCIKGKETSGIVLAAIPPSKVALLHLRP